DVPRLQHGQDGRPRFRGRARRAQVRRREIDIPNGLERLRQVHPLGGGQRGGCNDLPHREEVFRFFDDAERFGAGGTLPPARRASDRPIAMACLREVTFFPERPLRSVPSLRSFITFSTFSAAFFPYRAMLVLRSCNGVPVAGTVPVRT